MTILRALFPLACVAVVAFVARTLPPPVAAQATVSATRGGWAVSLLAAIGNDRPSASTVAFLEAWHRAEGGTATYNWLNTTQPAEGATDYNSVGVKNYPDYATGIQATAQTLTNGRYPRTLAGLVSNQPIVDDGEMGTWGTGGGAVRAQLAEAPQARASATGGAYMLQGDIGTNVLAALSANGGALQAFEIAPGATWSFGRSIKPIAAMGYLPVVCGPAGCNAGGGWCDLAALYVNVADQIGLESHFPAHGGINDPRFPGILLDDGNDDGDLWITNTTNATVTFRTRIEDGVVTIEGS